MIKVDYTGQVIGTREIIKNSCTDEDFTSVGMKIPAQSTRSSYKLTKCLNCGKIFPSSIKVLKRCPPKKCSFCSGIGFKGTATITRNTYGEQEDCFEISICYKDTTISCYIDKDDKDKVAQYSWRISQKKNKYYAVTGQAKNNTLVYMHNLIMGRTDFSDGNEVDHIDGNSLNNRKSNLRVISRLENIQNVSVRIDNQIGIRGVCKSRNKYKVDFSFSGVRYYFRDWDTIEEAVYCRKIAEELCDLHILERNPLAQEYLTLDENTKKNIYDYVSSKILGNQR